MKIDALVRNIMRNIVFGKKLKDCVELATRADGTSYSTSHCNTLDPRAFNMYLVCIGSKIHLDMI